MLRVYSSHPLYKRRTIPPTASSVEKWLTLHGFTIVERPQALSTPLLLLNQQPLQTAQHALEAAAHSTALQSESGKLESAILSLATDQKSAQDEFNNAASNLIALIKSPTKFTSPLKRETSISSYFSVSRGWWFDDFHFVKNNSPFVVELDSSFMETCRVPSYDNYLLKYAYDLNSIGDEILYHECYFEDGGSKVSAESKRGSDEATQRVYLIRRDKHTVMCDMVEKKLWQFDGIAHEVRSDKYVFLAIWYGHFLNEDDSRCRQTKVATDFARQRVPCEPGTTGRQIRRLLEFERRAREDLPVPAPLMSPIPHVFGEAFSAQNVVTIVTQIPNAEVLFAKWPFTVAERDTVVISASKGLWFDALLVLQSMGPASKTWLGEEGMKFVMSDLNIPVVKVDRRMSLRNKAKEKLNPTVKFLPWYPTTFRDVFRINLAAGQQIHSLNIDADFVVHNLFLDPQYCLVRLHEPSHAARLQAHANACFDISGAAQLSKNHSLGTFGVANPIKQSCLRSTLVGRVPRHALPYSEFTPDPTRPSISIHPSNVSVVASAFQCYRKNTEFDENAIILVSFEACPIDPADAAEQPLFMCSQIVAARHARHSDATLSAEELQSASLSNACVGPPRRAVAVITIFNASGTKILHQIVSHCELRPDCEMSVMQMEYILAANASKKEEIRKNSTEMFGPSVLASVLLLRSLSHTYPLLNGGAMTAPSGELEDTTHSGSDDDEEAPLRNRGRPLDDTLVSIVGSVKAFASNDCQLRLTISSEACEEVSQFSVAIFHECMLDQMMRRWRWFIGRVLRRDPSCVEEGQRWGREMVAHLAAESIGEDSTSEKERKKNEMVKEFRVMLDACTTRADFCHAFSFALRHDLFPAASKSNGAPIIRRRLQYFLPSSVDRSYEKKPCKYQICCDWSKFNARHGLTRYDSLVYMYLVALRASEPCAEEEAVYKRHLEEYIIPQHRGISKDEGSATLIVSSPRNDGTDVVVDVAAQRWRPLFDRKLRNFPFPRRFADKCLVMSSTKAAPPPPPPEPVFDILGREIIAAVDLDAPPPPPRFPHVCVVSQCAPSVGHISTRWLSSAAAPAPAMPTVVSFSMFPSSALTTALTEAFETQKAITGVAPAVPVVVAPLDFSCLPHNGDVVQLVVRVIEEDPQHPLQSNPFPSTVHQLAQEFEVDAEDGSIGFRGLRAFFSTMVNALDLGDAEMDHVLLPFQIPALNSYLKLRAAAHDA